MEDRYRPNERTRNSRAKTSHWDCRHIRQAFADDAQLHRILGNRAHLHRNDLEELPGWPIVESEFHILTK
jgi:hypothetical protein